ncbi:MAG: diaminopimelate epimerase [Phycisphaerae bacterium]
MRFTKMHGLGNDYVYVSTFDQSVNDPQSLAIAVSNRHRGIGSDGLILITPPTSKDAHARMRMFNADGSESEMCGNGIRCVGKFVYDHGIAKENPLRIETGAGLLTLDLEIEDSRVARVRVDMGAPRLAAGEIPVRAESNPVIGLPVSVGERTIAMTCVSMGNPHAVAFVDDVAQFPLAEIGPRIEKHPLFPQRINAHIVQILDERTVRMVTWERGSGATQACGTGACAVCVACVLNGLTARTITAHLPGGPLDLSWDEKTNHVFMTGPATEVFSGIW